MQVSVLDVILTGVLLFALIRGAMRGLFREVAAIGGVILGFMLANAFHNLLTSLAGQWIRNQEHAALVAYLVLFVGAVLAAYFLAQALSKLFQAADLGALLRATGAIAGLVKGILFCGIVLIMLSAFLNPRLLSQSRLTPYVLGSTHFLLEFVPERVQQKFKDNQPALRRLWERGLHELDTQKRRLGL